ncbi:MAG: DUF402 domain-containing protein [Lachnospiraceae bacterium]|nr:DUF402 domain-containing protein [Lachnospiraceae bacterium]
MYPTLYRKRIIPDECVKLKDDIILHWDDEMIVTKWNTLKPRTDFHHGYSLYMLKKGIKVSKFLREDDSLFYWYCDIVEYEEDKEQNNMVVTDLLIDITVDGEDRLKVLDVDELCEALETGLITDDMFHTAIKRFGTLVAEAQSGEFSKYTDIIEKYIAD